MNMLEENEIDYPLFVTILRPEDTVGEDGSYSGGYAVVAENVAAEIQLSLKIRNLVSENATGASSNTEWTMFANPPVKVLAGDRVTDDSRTFLVVETCDWGTHTEYYMRMVI